MPSLSLPDHETVFMEMSAVPRLNDKSARIIRMYTKMDLSKIKNDMNKFTLQIAEETDSLSASELWDKFEAEHHASIDKHIPSVWVNNKKHKLPYTTSSLQRLKKEERHKIYKV